MSATCPECGSVKARKGKDGWCKKSEQCVRRSADKASGKVPLPAGAKRVRSPCVKCGSLKSRKNGERCEDAKLCWGRQCRDRQLAAARSGERLCHSKRFQGKQRLLCGLPHGHEGAHLRGTRQW